MDRYDSLLAEQWISEDANLYTWSAKLGFKRCHSIPIASINSPPTGIGTYRSPIDLKPIVQGVFRVAPWHYTANLRRHGRNNGVRLARCRGLHR